MRQFTIFFAIVAAMGAAFASSSPVPNARSAPASADGFVDLLAGKEQQVFVPGPSTGDNAGLSLADALTLERKASLWWEYARDEASVTARLTRAGHTTLFVPTDNAIMALPHKPHNNPSGGTSDQDSQKNVEDFLSAHIVPSDIEEGGSGENLAGVKVELIKDGDSLVVKPGNARVVGQKAASNGRIYYIDGVVKSE